MEILRICPGEQLLFNIAKNPKYDGYQVGNSSLVYEFFNKNFYLSGVKTEVIPKQQLIQELHKINIRKCEKLQIYSSFKNNTWVAELVDMQLISKLNKVFHYLWCVIGIYSKYPRVVPLKYKKGITITSIFQKLLHGSNLKPNNIGVDEGSEFYNRSIKLWVQDNNINLSPIHNEGNSAFAERFIRTLKNKIFKYMISLSTNVYIDILDDTVNKYNNRK